MSDASVFEFDGEAHVNKEDTYLARMPAGLTNRDELFTALAKELRFPYFGRNWDALSDLLRDLSWIDEHRVVIVHEDVPALDAPSLAVYVDILAEAVRDWKPGEDHELVVVFPKETKGSSALGSQGVTTTPPTPPSRSS